MTTKLDVSVPQKRRTDKDKILLLSQKAKRLEREKAILQGQIKILNAEMNKSKHLVQQLKDLYSTVDSKIFRFINRRGYARQSRGATHVTKLVNYDDKSSLEYLFALAHRHDVVNGFHYNVRKGQMKLGYRIVGRIYRLGRDLAVAVAKASYRGICTLKGVRS